MVQVCVADDDQAIREVVAGLLRGEGFAVETFRDGATLLERAHAARAPLIVLFGVALLGLDGAAFLAALAANPPLTARHRFLLLTAWGRRPPPEAEALLPLMHVPVIEHPFDRIALLTAVAAAACGLACAGGGADWAERAQPSLRGSQRCTEPRGPAGRTAS